MRYFRIADINLIIQASDCYIHKDLNCFETREVVNNEIGDIECCVQKEQQIKGLMERKILIDSEYIKAFEVGDDFWIEYYTDRYCILVSIKTADGYASCYIQYLEEDSKELEVDICNCLFYVYRDIFFFFAQQRGRIAVHSSSILYKDKVYAFSASAGTGKTTHTNYWIEEYGVDILDGDVCMVYPQGDRVYAYGLPWAGTSGRFLNRRAELRGIVFLSQSTQNHAGTLNQFDGVLQLSARCFTPTWTGKMVDMNFAISEQVVARVPIFYLGCLPNRDSVETIKNLMDAIE